MRGLALLGPMLRVAHVHLTQSSQQHGLTIYSWKARFQVPCFKVTQLAKWQLGFQWPPVSLVNSTTCAANPRPPGGLDSLCAAQRRENESQNPAPHNEPWHWAATQRKRHFFLEFSQVNPVSAKGIHRPLKMVWFHAWSPAAEAQGL